MTAPSTAARGRRRAWATLAVIVGTVLIAVYGFRAWHQLDFNARVARGDIQVDSLRGWMTLPYIARTYAVPESALRAALGAPPTGDSQRSLRDWFDATGRDPASTRRAIEALILARRAAAAASQPGS